MLPATVQALLPRSLRTLSLSLNLGSIFLLGGCAGKAAANRTRRKHTDAAADSQGTPSRAGSSACSLDHDSAAAQPHSMAVLRRPSRWLRDQSLFHSSGARGFASLPCPVSDDEDDNFEWQQDDLVDLQWQDLWQQKQEALLAAQHRLAMVAAAPVPAAAPATAAMTPAGLLRQHLEQQQQQQYKLPAALQPKQQDVRQQATEAAQLSLGREQHAAHASAMPLPWERLGADEQRRQLAAYRAECQPYAKRSMHSMTLPFILEAYSMAVPPLEEAAVVFHPQHRGGRPCKQQQPQQQQQQRDWPGGAPSVSIGKALRRVLPPEAHPALAQALARLDACYSRGGAWNPSHGPAQLRVDVRWQAPGPTRAARMVGFLLEEAGASLEDVLGAIKASPWVLGLDLEKHARPTLDLLALYGFQQQQGNDAASLGEAGSQQQSTQVGRMLTSRPVLMLLAQEEHLRPMLQHMSDLGFSPSHAERLLRDNPVLSGPEGPQRLRLVVSFLAGKGLSREELVHVVTQVPRVLQYTIPQLQLKWQYMEQALGGGSKDIAACPYYLETSLVNVLGPRVALAHAHGVPILLPSEVEGEGRKRGGLKRAARASGRDERETGISLWKLLRDSTSKLAAKLGTTAEEFQRHVQHWQQQEAGKWQQVQPRELEHYMQLHVKCSSIEGHLATHQRCCSY